MVLPMTESKSAPDPAQPLDVLMIEDNEADAELCSRELRKAGFEPRVERVQTAQAVPCDGVGQPCAEHDELVLAVGFGRAARPAHSAIKPP